jgi:nucleoid-associated protein YgaU
VVSALTVKPGTGNAWLFPNLDGDTMPSNNKPSPDFSDVSGGSGSTAPADRPRTITVQAGDSLSKIAKRELGDANKWQALYEANRDKIKDPDLIHPGQVLDLPSA